MSPLGVLNRNALSPQAITNEASSELLKAIQAGGYGDWERKVASTPSGIYYSSSTGTAPSTSYTAASIK